MSWLTANFKTFQSDSWKSWL